jgi:hypothetical protein
VYFGRSFLFVLEQKNESFWQAKNYFHFSKFNERTTKRRGLCTQKRIVCQRQPAHLNFASQRLERNHTQPVLKIHCYRHCAGSLLLSNYDKYKTLITNKCTKRVISLIVTHSYMFRPCWVIFRENFFVILTLRLHFIVE